jgi:hypothetical protein
MAKNKYDFIKELIEDPKLNLNQRERILELASKEFRFEGTLEQRLQKIEEILFNKQDADIFRTNVKSFVWDEKDEILEESNNGEFERFSETAIQISTKDNNQIKYLNPYHLYNFLLEYNQNQILRTTCHDIDSNELKSILEFCKSEKYIFREHLKVIQDAYVRHENKYKAPYQVKAIIRGYLTGKDFYGEEIEGWSFENIRINWNSTELLNWTEINIGTPPNLNVEIAGSKEIELLEFSQIRHAITAMPIQNFTQLVLHFKNLFHIKSGPQSLRQIIERVNFEKRWEEKVSFEFDENGFINNLEHFTDVEKLIQAYNKIIGLIVEQNKQDEKAQVKLKYYEENQKVIISIQHMNGKYNKTIENTIERLGQTYTSLIKNQINGLCNLYLKADFGNNKFASINLWNGKNRVSEILPTFLGVEHILEFPKTEKS